MEFYGPRAPRWIAAKGLTPGGHPPLWRLYHNAMTRPQASGLCMAERGPTDPSEVSGRAE